MISSVTFKTWAHADSLDAEAEDAAAPSDDSKPVTRLPETVVTGTVLQEERAISPNGQPEWTARRRFAETRICVLPPWQLSLETSWRFTKPRGEQDSEEGGEKDPQHRLTQELGLASRIAYSSTTKPLARPTLRQRRMALREPVRRASVCACGLGKDPAQPDALRRVEIPQRGG
jgi:hypothetical protein